MDIRDGTPGDVAWATGIAPELAAFGLPAWRDRRVFVEQCRASLRRGLESGDPRDVVRVAVDASGTRIGLVHMVLRPDVNTGRDAVHIDDLIVEPAHRGRGVGSALCAEAERWAGECGAGSLALAVFQDNTDARRLYERVGYRDDVVRVVKPIG